MDRLTERNKDGIAFLHIPLNESRMEGGTPMNTALHDPDQVRNEYIAKKRRQRRLQLVPPMNYWNKYKEMTDEDEFCQAVNEVMDMFMKPFLLIVPALIIALITYHLRLFWLPPVICIGTVVWWLGWGRKRYEQ